MHEAQLLGGRYRLVERLGEGGMAVIWRGHDEVLRRDVAVKVLAPRLAEEEAFGRRLRREARSAARLCHPHIMAVYDYGESSTVDGRSLPYVVMELVDGECLATRLAAGGLPWRTAVTACAQVASALATAHACGIVHRDVTPANVMLTDAGAKVVDFGISALTGESDVGPDGNLLGTPAYLAPERLDGGRVEPATDVYGLGLLLYKSLAGRLPWPEMTTVQMLKAHRYAEPAPLPRPVAAEVPAEVVGVCRRCLAKRPTDRPASAEVARTLADIIHVVLPLPAPRVKPTWKPDTWRAQPEPVFGEGEHALGSSARAQPEPQFGEGEHALSSSARAQPEPGLDDGEHVPSSPGASERTTLAWSADTLLGEVNAAPSPPGDAILNPPGDVTPGRDALGRDDALDRDALDRDALDRDALGRDPTRGSAGGDVTLGLTDEAVSASRVL